MLGLLEIQYVIVRLDGFQAENLDEGTGFLAEMQTRLYDLGIEVK